MFAVDDYAACSPLSSFYEGFFSSFEHSSSGETCFCYLFFESLKNFRWLDFFCSKKFDNNARFTLTDIFRSFISLVELSQD